MADPRRPAPIARVANPVGNQVANVLRDDRSPKLNCGGLGKRAGSLRRPALSAAQAHRARKQAPTTVEAAIALPEPAPL